MGIRDNIEKIFDKLGNNKEEYAVVFKSVNENEDSISYIPIGIVSGKLDADNMSFIGKKKVFSHLIKGPKDYGFAFAKTLTESINANRIVPPVIQMRKLLKSLSNFVYIYGLDEHNNPIVGVQVNDNVDDVSILYEEELLDYYIKNYPDAKEIIHLLKKASGNINLDIEDISKNLDINYSNSKQAKQILTGVWKHLHSDKPYHIFINGSDITPKKEIITSICEYANIPYYYAKAVDDYEIFDINKLLKKILKKYNNNLNEAEKIVLIFDNIDKLAISSLSTESFAKGQFDLSKLLSGKKIELILGKFKGISKKIKFDTSKMMIIGLGDFKDKDFDTFKVAGFVNQEKNMKEKNRNRSGMLVGLFDYFSMIIQMNEPNLKDYQNVLMNRKESGLAANNGIFDDLGIKLTIPNEVISELSKYAYDNHMSSSDIRSLVEKIFADATYNIAKNPEEYEELIVSGGIIRDNKKYTLVRKKNNEK